MNFAKKAIHANREWRNFFARRNIAISFCKKQKRVEDYMRGTDLGIGDVFWELRGRTDESIIALYIIRKKIDII